MKSLLSILSRRTGQSPIVLICSGSRSWRLTHLPQYYCEPSNIASLSTRGLEVGNSLAPLSLRSETASEDGGEDTHLLNGSTTITTEGSQQSLGSGNSCTTVCVAGEESSSRLRVGEEGRIIHGITRGCYCVSVQRCYLCLFLFLNVDFFEDIYYIRDRLKVASSP